MSEMMRGDDVVADHMLRTAEFWTELELNVAARVEAALSGDKTMHEPLIVHLRELEEMVRANSDSRQTIQIIASSRRLLGDKKHLGRGSDLITRRL